MKNLIELYTSIAASVGITADSQGFMSTVLPGSEKLQPWTVDSKRVVLPIPEQLQQTDWSGRIGFHPLLQSVAGGESRVLEKFRDRMNGYSDFMLGMLMLDIAQLGMQKDQHIHLDPVQAKYLGPFSDADGKFVKLLTELVGTKRVVKKNFEFVRFSVIKGRQWQGQKRARVAVMHFPLYEALPADGKGTTILGHTLRQKDVKMLRAMYEFLYPDIRTPNFYEVGSDSKIGPSIESLMTLYGEFALAQNKAVAILEPVIGTSNALQIVTDWREDLSQVEKYLPEIRKIPLLEGNAPANRIETAGSPQRIAEAPTAAVIRTTSADAAPVIPANMPMAQPVQHGVQQVQQTNAVPAPRFKLGVKSPTVTTETATHQISNEVASQVGGLNYMRPGPVTAPVQPTPPVGSLLQAQQPQTQQVFGNPAMGGQVIAGAQLQQPAQAQAMKVPESARLYNGALYIPVESSGVSGIPQNAVMIDNRVYVPLIAGAGAVAPAAGFNPNANRFGMQQQITDPSQIPGLSEQEIMAFRANPVMFQNFLQQMNQTSAMAATNVLTQRQQQVPRYLQNAVQQAQQQQTLNQGFFGRRM
jgi:hypothetical protein